MSKREVSEKQAERIQYYRTHVPTWLANASALGLSPELVAELGVKTDEAIAAYKALHTARLAAMNATLRANLAIADMAKLGSSLIKQIRARALIDGDGVYPLASIDPPGAGAPLPPPGKPSDIQAKLGTIGELTLTWKCKNPRGASTMYHIWRRIVTGGKRGAGSARTFLGAIGKKRFVDETLPAGTAQVIYEIQAVRSTAVGATATFPVNFGTDGSERLPTFTPKGEAAKVVA